MKTHYDLNYYIVTLLRVSSFNFFLSFDERSDLIYSNLNIHLTLEIFLYHHKIQIFIKMCHPQMKTHYNLMYQTPSNLTKCQTFS